MVRDGGRGGDYKKERDLSGNGKVLYPNFSFGYTNLQVIIWHGIMYTLYTNVSFVVLLVLQLYNM